VIEVGPQSAALAQRLIATPQPITSAAVEDRLLWACEYIDDEHWCLKQQQELGLEKVVLTHEQFNPRFGITLAVPEATVDEPQLVPLVRQALAYRKVDGAVVELLGDRIAIYLGEPIYARVRGVVYESVAPAGVARLAELQQNGVSFGRELRIAELAAS